MSDLNEQATRWLEEHAAELEQEELPTEQEKMEADRALADGRWPEPKPVSDMGIFAEIIDEEGFNRVIGDPENWPIIQHRSVLYRNWILPQAILVFGKRWFDRCKWRSSIQRGLRFPLFSEDERFQAREGGIALEDTGAGRVKIARISARVEHALAMYLDGGGRIGGSRRTKQPGGYIVDSIKNEFMREIADERGYKLERTRACPYCLKTRRGRARRVALTAEHGHWYSCERCAAVTRNLEMNLDSLEGADLERATAMLENVRVFARMSGTAAVCPDARCQGIVPLSAVRDPTWWQTPKGGKAKAYLKAHRPLKGSKRFRPAPNELRDVPLRCPYCGLDFTPRSLSCADYPNGVVTGLPTIFVWRTQNMDRLDKPNTIRKVGGRYMLSSPSLKDCLTADTVDVEGRIAAKQRARLLAGELALKAKAVDGTTVAAIMSRCFYQGAADWVIRNPEDASAYFLEWETEQDAEGRASTKVVKGSQASIHQAILRAWLLRIQAALPELKKAKGGRMRSLIDLKWLCRPPKYKGGPKTVFEAEMEHGLRVPNNSTLGQKAKNRPRLAWVLSVRTAAGRDVTSHVRDYEWHAIYMDPASGLVPGEKIRVEALMMPGHRCHAPIQRIIRLRTSVLAPLAERIKREEETGEADADFWTGWRERAEAAMTQAGIAEGASE